MHPSNTKRPDITIIGGGFCGVVTLMQLVRQADGPLSVTLVNKENPLARGIAFSSYNPRHLLNVAAGKMSAFPELPEHFTEWVLSKSEFSEYHLPSLPELFLPRIIYGAYLSSALDECLKQLPAHIQIEIKEDEAVDIDCTGGLPCVSLKNGSSFYTRKVILATGNFIPANPGIKNKGFYNDSKGYFSNPWTADAIRNASSCEDILIIGTGLTMVDNVLSIMESGFKGKITAVSTKGFFPLSHKKTAPYTAILSELDAFAPLVNQYHIFKRHIRKVLEEQVTGEVVVDAVRPLTQQIWLNLSLKEKKSFMHHLRHLWGVARHRLPAGIHDKMISFIRHGRLEIIPGRLYDMAQNDNGKISACITERRTGKKIELSVDRVINCTGPQMDIRKIENSLIRNLLARELICPDEMSLGMCAQPDGTILNSRNEPSSHLFTLGSNLKGILWESTAVPELRVQAKNIAKKLLNELNDVEEEKIPVIKNA
jgi:uncharacterized NAD(P)/FAD-binding protein YdhS